MRINVYAEEMTGDVELVTKAGVIGADGNSVTFYGVRIYLEGSDKLHQTEHDDDRPAITYWVGTVDDASLIFNTMTNAADIAREVYQRVFREDMAARRLEGD